MVKAPFKSVSKCPRDQIREQNLATNIKKYIPLKKTNNPF